LGQNQEESSQLIGDSAAGEGKKERYTLEQGSRCKQLKMAQQVSIEFSTAPPGPHQARQRSGQHCHEQDHLG
jgi:hypothetical protein